MNESLATGEVCVCMYIVFFKKLQNLDAGFYYISFFVKCVSYLNFSTLSKCQNL